MQILFQRKLFGKSAVRFRNIGLGVTVALIPFDGGSVAGANELSGRELLKLLLDGVCQEDPVYFYVLKMTFAVLSVDGKGTSDAQKTAQKEDILFFIKPYYKRKVKRRNEKDTISY